MSSFQRAARTDRPCAAAKRRAAPLPRAPPVARVVHRRPTPRPCRKMASSMGVPVTVPGQLAMSTTGPAAAPLPVRLAAVRVGGAERRGANPPPLLTDQARPRAPPNVLCPLPTAAECGHVNARRPRGRHYVVVRVARWGRRGRCGARPSFAHPAPPPACAWLVCFPPPCTLATCPSRRTARALRR